MSALDTLIRYELAAGVEPIRHTLKLSVLDKRKQTCKNGKTFLRKPFKGMHVTFTGDRLSLMGDTVKFSIDGELRAYFYRIKGAVFLSLGGDEELKVPVDLVTPFPNGPVTVYDGTLTISWEQYTSVT